MRLSALVLAIALAATIGAASAAAQSGKPEGATKAPAASAAPQFATLNGVKAAPMASRELDAVKGLHIHFFVNGVLHVVNHRENNLGGGQAPPPSGPGYSGLCNAQQHSGAISGAVPC